MNEYDSSPLDHRVLVIAPTRRDGLTTEALLNKAGVFVRVCATFDEAIEELGRGAAVLMLTEEVCTPVRVSELAELLRQQPPWSDLPILILTRTGANSWTVRDAARSLGNVVLLERPIRVDAVLSAVLTAGRARERQYQIRGHLLERARAEASLRLADRRKDEFLATLAHELRNPLAPLKSGAQLLRLECASDSQTSRIVGIIERQVAHLTRLVDDLLEVSRITRGLVEVRREPLDLLAVLRAAVETSRPSIDAGKHELSLNLPSGPVAVKGDAVRLTQVFSNLLVNAAKYTNAGGHVSLSMERRADSVRVIVKDSGIGIAPSDLSSIFDMFTQLDTSDHRGQGGLGVGLTLVKSLVELHDGRVDAFSAGHGEGSEFVVTLPLLFDTPARAEECADLSEFPDRRILIVDDSQDAAETLGELLEALGATVSVALDGYAALDRIERFAPDTVVLDLGMPDMDGFEVARRIRQLPRHASTTLIALTGLSQQQDRNRSRAAGFDHHLVKPANVDALRDLLMNTVPKNA